MTKIYEMLRLLTPAIGFLIFLQIQSIEKRFDLISSQMYEMTRKVSSIEGFLQAKFIIPEK